MKQFYYHDSKIQVSNGILYSEDTALLSYLNALLKSTFGKFNNSEVYPDKDSAIAHYIQEALRGK